MRADVARHGGEGSAGPQRSPSGHTEESLPSSQASASMPHGGTDAGLRQLSSATLSRRYPRQGRPLPAALGRSPVGEPQVSDRASAPVWRLFVSTSSRDSLPTSGVEIETTVEPSGHIKVTVRHATRDGDSGNRRRITDGPALLATPADLTVIDGEVETLEETPKRTVHLRWTPPKPSTPRPTRKGEPQEVRQAVTQARNHWQAIVGWMNPKLSGLLPQIIGEFGLLQFFEAVSICLAQFPDASANTQVGHLLSLLRGWRKLAGVPEPGTKGAEPDSNE